MNDEGFNAVGIENIYVPVQLPYATGGMLPSRGWHKDAYPPPKLLDPKFFMPLKRDQRPL